MPEKTTVAENAPTQPLILTDVDAIELQVAEAVAAIEDARQLGEPSRIEDWVQKYPEAADRIREAVATSTWVDSVLSNAGMKLSIADDDISEAIRVEFEDFELGRVLQSSSMGVVYEAIQKSTHRKVALKTLPEGLLANARRRKLFEREVEAVAALHHPNIVPIFNSGLAKGQYYFAMQFIDGYNLDDYVRRLRKRTAGSGSLGRLVETVPVESILRLMLKVCHAVHYAHLKGVIHRDLKPSNILVDLEGEPHLVDFGLAKVLTPDSRQEQVDSAVSLGGHVFGTLPYLAPEQARGRTEDIDVRTDVYGLGVVLYKLLTDRYPYDVKGSLPDVLNNIQYMDPLPPHRALVERGVDRASARKTINDEIETIVLKALAKRPEARYQSVAALGHDIERYLTGGPIEAKRTARWLYVSRKFINRHAFPITLICLIVILAVAWARELRSGRQGIEVPPEPSDSVMVRQMEEWKARKAAEDAEREAAAEAAAEARMRELGETYLVAQLRLAHERWLVGDEASARAEFLQAAGTLGPSVTKRLGMLDEAMAALGERETFQTPEARFDEFAAWCRNVALQIGFEKPSGLSDAHTTDTP